jgi:UDP-N-acetylmuramoyl-L-alanyl-D-glutamate--2,6-diaminopimelate ligase
VTAATFAADELFRGQALLGACPSVFSGLSRDSRTVCPGEAFVLQSNDQSHLDEAFRRGATACVSPLPAPRSPLLLSPHPRFAFARASCAAHGLDRRCPPLLAATGTKGKSTITHLVWWLLGSGAARVGTIGWHDGVTERPNRQTTPPPDELHAFLAGLPAGCPGVALEASSHGCDQFRLAGLTLSGLAVTGIGHDHLDYHGTQAAYVAAKLRAVQLLTPGARLILNADDAYVDDFAAAGARVGAQVVRLSGERGAGSGVTAFQHLPPGRFNRWNAEAALLLVESLGVNRDVALARLASLPAIPGRLERMAEAPVTYVDYAHTAESLALVIDAVREAHPGAPLAIVFGCGGDRDRSKRAPMGAAATAADLVVITTDNSRSEDPQAIAAEILVGVGAHPHAVEPERAAAIRLARQRVGVAGVVIVAGKGHETTQDIRGVVSAWDDRAFVRGLESA